jgi:DNA-directed RNA polymerase sigma subunit (sigma70/sigma32)
MCGRWIDSEPCVNYKCPHNLFWEGLKLNRAKVKITGKALEIRNCCCLINEPWTREEIGDIWGLTKKRIKQCEDIAWRKMYKERTHKQLRKPTVP